MERYLLTMETFNSYQYSYYYGTNGFIMCSEEVGVGSNPKKSEYLAYDGHVTCYKTNTRGRKYEIEESQELKKSKN
jgi:hypothetical protein